MVFSMKTVCIRDDALISPPPLPAPLILSDDRAFPEKWRIRILTAILRYTIDFLSIPLYVWPVKNRFRTRIDTGVTGKCRMCIYYPKKGHDGNFDSVPRGVLIHLHGGGWSACRPETEAVLCKYLCDNLNVIVVAPDYRKTPLYPYPHALEQIYNVLCWIATDGLSTTLAARKVPLIAPVDRSRIAISGGSAGSNLAASVTLLTLTRPLPNEAKVTALGLLYPSLNFTVPYRDKLARVDPTRVLPPFMSKLWLKAYLPPPRDLRDPYISPALAPQCYLKQFPPTLILTAEYDYLAYEAEEWVILLEQAGVRVNHKRFAKVGHAFDGMPTFGVKQRRLNEKAREEAWGMMVREFQIGLIDLQE